MISELDRLLHDYVVYTVRQIELFTPLTYRGIGITLAFINIFFLTFTFGLLATLVHSKLFGILLLGHMLYILVETYAELNEALRMNLVSVEERPVRNKMSSFKRKALLLISCMATFFIALTIALPFVPSSWTISLLFCLLFFVTPLINIVIIEHYLDTVPIRK